MEISVPMVAVECCMCHMPFTMTKEFNTKLRRCHNTFYCPAGHGQSYTGKSDLDQMREERDTAIHLKLAAQAELEALKKKKCRKGKSGGNKLEKKGR